MSIYTYYKCLGKKEKSEFIKQVIAICDISYVTVLVKIREDTWTKLEREAITKMIEEKKHERSGVL